MPLIEKTDEYAKLNPRLVRRGFARAAVGYDEDAFLPREVSLRMSEQLDFLKIEPQRVLDLGCGTGADAAMLTQRYPQAACVGLDVSLPMLEVARKKTAYPGAALCADMRALPVAADSLDLVWSNLTLPFLHDPLPAFKEVARVLTKGGAFMFSTLGPDSLKELRAAFAAADGGMSPHVSRQLDMHDVGDALVKAGLAEPVMVREYITLTYQNIARVFSDLRSGGSRNALYQRSLGLMGRGRWQQMLAALEAGRDAESGAVPLTFEIVYGLAWKGAPQDPNAPRPVRIMPR